MSPPEIAARTGIIRHRPGARSPGTAEDQFEFAGRDLGKGRQVLSIQLEAESFRVRIRKLVSVIDGPFVESKEVIGGWAILDVASKAEAIRIATEFMELHREHWPGFPGESEVREMLEQETRP